MKYLLQDAALKDKKTIYTIKKKSIKPYVEKIWGWDENYQSNDFDNSFTVDNFKTIIINNQIIGFLEFFITDDIINISEIHIMPEFQSQGIGRNIIEHIAEKGRASNKNITLGCFRENINALKFYKELGFTINNETATHFHLVLEAKKPD